MQAQALHQPTNDKQQPRRTCPTIVSGEVTMTGTLRTFEPETRKMLWAEMEQACGVARALGGAVRRQRLVGLGAGLATSLLHAVVQRLGVPLWLNASPLTHSCLQTCVLLVVYWTCRNN